MDKVRSTLKQFVRDWSEEVGELALQGYLLGFKYMTIDIDITCIG